MTAINLIRIGFVIAPLAVATGCSMPKASDFKPSKLFSLKDDEEPEKGTPTRIVSTWTDTVLSQPGKTPQRGFGGRLIFYERDDEKPILVDGQLVVYAFDETNRAITDNKPTRRYVFPPEQLPRHMSNSELGASYSFWLPWDDVGGPQTEVSLICRFEARGGTVVTSEQTRHRLPGTMTAPVITADGRPAPPKLPEGVPSRPAQPTLESVQQSRMVDRNLQLANYESTAVSNAYAATAAGGTGTAPFDPQRQMTTTSIALPPNYQLPMGAVAAGPMPSQAVGIPQHAVQSFQQQPPALQQHLPAVSPMTPAQQPLPAAIQTMPGAYAPMNHARLGAFPAHQRPGMPTVATPTIATPTIATPTLATPTIATPTTYSPTSGGFGFGSAAASQPASQPAVPQLGRSANLRMHAWNNVQTTVAQNSNMPLAQQQANGSGQLPRTITQPASQPLPPPTGLTTTVSYPTPATALR